MQAPCRIQLFGCLRVQQGDRVITRFRTQKTALLLGYLARHAGRMHPREVLIELLWPGADPNAGRNSLSTALSSLRRQLEPPGTSPGTVIQADRLASGLHPAAVSVDVLEFEGGLRAATSLKQGPRHTQLLAESVDLYRGEFLSGFYDDWVLLEQRRLGEACGRAIGDLAGSLERQGDLDGALRYAWMGVSIDPLREEAHREVMRLHALAGQPDLALRQFRELEGILSRELQATPSEETLRLRRAIEGGVLPHRSPGLSAPAPAVAPPPLPSGTITFVLCDRGEAPGTPDGFVEGSPEGARLVKWVRRYGGMPAGLGEGASTAAFTCANDALACVLAMQADAAGAEPAVEWRFALDTGQSEAHEGRYRSAALSQARRLLLATHPGQVLCSARTAALVQVEPDPGVRLQDLGAYRLRADGGSEHVFQAEPASAPPRRHPALNAPGERTGNLRAPLTRFIGRGHEMGQLQHSILEEGNRLVTLTGPAGCGKTRLALEGARRLQERFPGGVWFIAAADLATAEQIPEAIRSVLHLPGPAQSDPLREVVDALQGGAALLLLDNLEHLAPEAAPITQALLERTTALVCLCTSRRRLQVPGEREMVVAPLGTPGAEEDPARVLESDSVRLFRDRAQAVQPDFQVTRANAGAVAALCTRLDGLPLALEIAAARAQVLTPAQMLERLASGADAAPARPRAGGRHRSVREAIDWSYGMLPPQLQCFFDRLSLFRGGCTAEAAQSVCREPLALDLLGRLRGFSLLQSEVQHPETRFRMLETLREYGRGHLAAAERGQLSWRHAEYYLHLAETGRGELFKPAQAEWLGRLAPEQENVRAAIEWGLGPGGDREVAARLVAAVWPFWYAHAQFREGRRQIGRVLSSGAAVSGVLRGRLLAGGGVLALVRGDLPGAARLCGEALPVCREAADPWGTSLSLFVLGLAACSRQELRQAEALYRESLTVARAAGDSWCAALDLCGLSDCAGRRGAHRDAAELAAESVALAHAGRDRWLTAWAVGTQGVAALGCGDREGADRLCRESLDLFLDLGDLTGALNCLEALAQIHGTGLRLAKAARLLGAARALRERIEAEPLPDERRQLRRGEMLLRVTLGKARYEAEWERGYRTRVADLAALAAEGA